MKEASDRRNISFRFSRDSLPIVGLDATISEKKNERL